MQNLKQYISDKRKGKSFTIQYPAFRQRNNRLYSGHFVISTTDSFIQGYHCKEHNNQFKLSSVRSWIDFLIGKERRKREKFLLSVLYVKVMATKSYI